MEVATAVVEGQPGCIGLANDTVDLVVTTALGPRVVRDGFRDGPMCRGRRAMI